MARVIRFTVENKNISLLVLDNGAVSQLRYGDITYTGTPPSWVSLKDWAENKNELLAAYFELFPGNISEDVRRLICFIINNDMEPLGLKDNLNVKTGDVDEPLYITTNGKLKYKKQLANSLNALGVSANQIWLKDTEDNIISFEHILEAKNVNDMYEDTLDFKIEPDGTIYWLHPIYSWFSEKDGDILPEWLKRLVEKHPRFRGWRSIELVTQDNVCSLENAECGNKLQDCSGSRVEDITCNAISEPEKEELNTDIPSLYSISNSSASTLLPSYYGSVIPIETLTKCVDENHCNMTYYIDASGSKVEMLNRDIEYCKSQINNMEKLLSQQSNTLTFLKTKLTEMNKTNNLYSNIPALTTMFYSTPTSVPNATPVPASTPVPAPVTNVKQCCSFQ